MFLPISHILSHVRTPSIRTLIFTFWGANSGDFGMAVAHLGGVAAALSCNRAFGDLRRVVVRLPEPRFNEAVYASVRLTFKRFEERGLLTFENSKVRSSSVALRIYSYEGLKRVD